MNPRVKKVRALSDYRLRLSFTNGEVKLYDAKPLLDQGVFRSLRDPAAFESVAPAFGTVVWPGGQDICPDTLYENSTPARPMVARESRTNYATAKRSRKP